MSDTQKQGRVKQSCARLPLLSPTLIHHHLSVIQHQNIQPNYHTCGTIQKTRATKYQAWKQVQSITREGYTLIITIRLTLKTLPSAEKNVKKKMIKIKNQSQKKHISIRRYLNFI